MDLYLVRHAIAGVRDPAAWPDDDLRPLTKRGTRRFQRAARGLRQLVPSVDRVLSSPKVRAWETAVILQAESGWPAPEVCNELGDASPDAVLRALEPHTRLKSLALVGHEPYLSMLIAAIVAPSGASIEMRKGGVAKVTVDDLATRSGAVLCWLLPPRVLRALP